jgi:hypothetical protein
MDILCDDKLQIHHIMKNLFAKMQNKIGRVNEALVRLDVATGSQSAPATVDLF